jgi:selT/selW/selH-like putative selenoprotein
MRYSDLIISGSNYPPSSLRQALSKFVSLFQIGTLFLTLAGGFFATIRNHPFYQKVQDNKLFIILGAFIGLNFVKTMLDSTGAFEVYFNGVLIHSKLLTGKMPEIHDILSKIKL